MGIQETVKSFSESYAKYFNIEDINDLIYHISVGFVLMSMIGAWLQYFGININYGRGSNSFFGIYFNGKLAWFLWELPNLIIAAYFLFLLQRPLTYGFLLFIIHYINRDIIHPLTLAGSTPVPFQILVSGILFTSANGYLQATSNSKNSTEISSKMILGFALFFIGMAVNLYSDHVLRTTRAQTENRIQKIKREDPDRKVQASQKYKRIDKFLFKYVCCPNYLGQIVEWFGYYLVCQTQQSLLFALSTLVILTAFALNRNDWSKKNIKDYPKNRKGVIPFII